MSALLLPVMIGLWWMPLPFACWVLGVKSGAFIGLYFASLSMAYRLGDMSIIYPLARSAPLFLLTWTAIVMGVRFDVYGYIGVGLVGLGAVVLPMFTGLGWRRWFNMANLWAMVTALATTGYSLCDHAAMNIIEKNYAGTFDHVARSVCYLWIQFSFGWVVLSVLLLCTKRRPQWRGRSFTTTAALVGGLMVLTYCLVLLALMTNEVSYVVGFRQLSVVIGVVLGIIYFHEREGMLGRLAGAGIITVGLVLISVAK